ncbi:ribosomal protein S4 (mitochondrion) [Bryopsis sp. KO-2023]|nr:ribosomal protein S4 [Bryopsis sp. KO-2023]
MGRNSKFRSSFATSKGKVTSVSEPGLRSYTKNMANKLVRKFKSCLNSNLKNSYENIWPSKKCSNKLQYKFKQNICVFSRTFDNSSDNRGVAGRKDDPFRQIKIQFHLVCLKHYAATLFSNNSCIGHAVIGCKRPPHEWGVASQDTYFTPFGGMPKCPHNVHAGPRVEPAKPVRHEPWRCAQLRFAPCFFPSEQPKQGAHSSRPRQILHGSAHQPWELCRASPTARKSPANTAFGIFRFCLPRVCTGGPFDRVATGASRIGQRRGKYPWGRGGPALFVCSPPPLHCVITDLVGCLNMSQHRNRGGLLGAGKWAFSRAFTNPIFGAPGKQHARSSKMDSIAKGRRPSFFDTSGASLPAPALVPPGFLGAGNCPGRGLLPLVRVAQNSRQSRELVRRTAGSYRCAFVESQVFRLRCSQILLRHKLAMCWARSLIHNFQNSRRNGFYRRSGGPNVPVLGANAHSSTPDTPEQADNAPIHDPHNHLLPIYVLRRTLYRTVNQKSATQLKGLYRFQLQETRKFALVYGNLSKKFLQQVAKKTLFSKSVEAFLDLLEKRLDVVVFRAGFCFSIFQSRHLINHKFICVNGNLLTIPSYPCRPGDIISCKPFPLECGCPIFPTGGTRRRRFVKNNHENFYRRIIEYRGAYSFTDRRLRNTLPLAGRGGDRQVYSDQKHLWPRRTIDPENHTSREKREMDLTRPKLYSPSTGNISKRPRPTCGRNLLLPLANKNASGRGGPGLYQQAWRRRLLNLGGGRPRVSLTRARFKVVPYFHRSWEVNTFAKPKAMGHRDKQYVNSSRQPWPIVANRLRLGVIKPLQLEINYRCLTAVYLYPTQRIIWPTFLDLDLVIRELTR